MRVVLALGGNALMKRGEPLEAATLQRNLVRAASAIAPIIRAHEVVITHGNGPQIGLLALQAAAYREVAPYPLDILGAESEGMIGYLIEAALAAELGEREIATLLTQVEVDPADPAFAAPDKPIGPVYSEEHARQLAAASGWAIMRDGDGWRRAVASPAPRRIRELRTIELLVASGVIVICAGGGGIPVAVTPEGALRGVEAVIDKDRAAALLAAAVGADALLLLTDVAGVWSQWPAQDRSPVGRTTPSGLRRHRFAPGSMGPKVEAACRFVEATGRRAAIGGLDEAQSLLEGTCGTQVTPD